MKKPGKLIAAALAAGFGACCLLDTQTTAGVTIFHVIAKVIIDDIHRIVDFLMCSFCE